MKKDWITLALIGLAIFCWFQLRPFLARRDCGKRAIQTIKNYKYLQDADNAFKFVYDKCLLRWGITK